MSRGAVLLQGQAVAFFMKGIVLTESDIHRSKSESVFLD